MEKFFQKLPFGSRPSQEPSTSTSTSTRKNGDNEVMSNKNSVVRVYDCVVRKKYCTTHEKPAEKIVSSRKCWTRNRKTGLYSYVQRKVTGWRCEGGVVLDISTKLPEWRHVVFTFQLSNHIILRSSLLLSVCQSVVLPHKGYYVFCLCWREFHYRKIFTIKDVL